MLKELTGKVIIAILQTFKITSLKYRKYLATKLILVVLFKILRKKTYILIWLSFDQYISTLVC